MKTIGVVLFEGVEELDFAGPWEVFSYTARTAPESCTVLTVAERGGVVRCAKGLRVVADHSFDDCPPLDIVLAPGGAGTRSEVDNPRLIAFLQRMAAGCELVASVCTGAFLLERAGFLTGRRATTHWASLDRLRSLGTVTVVEERFVDEGRAVTSAGISAGIDMSLYLVARLWGSETARAVQQGIEYFPAPRIEMKLYDAGGQS
jgi:transcriptional regulator GlxA family with amidase domain